MERWLSPMLLSLFLTLLFSFSDPSAAFAFADSDSSKVGKLVYYEGFVELGNGTSWSKVKIDQAVRKNQSIRVHDGMAEIVWDSGVKSVVGPNSITLVSALMSGSASKAKVSTESSFTSFKSIFNSSDAKKRNEEGGIRRTETETRKKPAKDEIYWKSDEEIFFDDAYALYESEKYNEAIAAFHAYLDQKPNEELVKYARFALGHCYIMSNNTVKAKEIFDRFVIEYPEDDLTPQAQAILDQL